MRAAIAALGLVVAAGCTPERVEYHRRSDLVRNEGGDDEFIAADGTRVVFVDPRAQDEERLPRGTTVGPDGKPVPVKQFQPREELEDGTVVLRNVFPDHVVGNAMTCIRREEYRLMWDQLLAPETRAAWERSGGYDGFQAWCRENRRAAMELLNRMQFDAMGSDVSMKQVRPGVMQATVAPHLWEQFSLRVVEFEQTTDGMKLLSIRPAP